MPCERRHKPEPASSFSARSWPPSWRPGRDLRLGDGYGAACDAGCLRRVRATDPLYILYTSGTTGKPKGVVRDNGGHAVALKWSMKNIYDIEPGDVFWAASDVGWVVGHSYIVYAPLLCWLHHRRLRGQAGRHPRSRRLLAGYRRAQGQGPVHRSHRASARSSKEDPEGALSEEIRHLQLCRPVPGRRASRPRYLPLGRATLLKYPGRRPLVADGDRLGHRGQLHGYRAAARQGGLADQAGVRDTTCEILDASGPRRCRRHGRSSAIKLPLPPGSSHPLAERQAVSWTAIFETSPGYYVTGDGGHIDSDGYVFVMGRVDDVINVAGHRLSTGRMEEVIATHPDVAECAVVGVADSSRDRCPSASSS